MDIEKIKKTYMIILEDFDKIPKDTLYQRRAAFNCLWDYFQKLILDVGIHLCGLYKEALKISHLKTRWNKVKISLSAIENPKQWDDLIDKVDKLRQRIQHSDKDQRADPKNVELEEIRKKSPEFLDWILEVGLKFHRTSQKFTLTDYFKRTIGYYISQSEIILANFGEEKVPYVARYVYEPYVKGDMYLDIPKLKKFIEKRKYEINNINDISQSDLESLVNLIEITSKINAWEDALLKDNMCPKCGGKIVSTNTPFGGTIDDPEPDGVYYRVGCEKCDYYLDDDTV